MPSNTIDKAIGWRDIGIREKRSGESFLVFSGPAQELAAKRGVTAAMACIVLDG